jgi:hypothetical protein
MIPAALIAQQLVADSSLTFYVVLERSLRQNLAPPEVLHLLGREVLPALREARTR